MNQESREVSSSLARRYAQAFLSVYGQQITDSSCEHLSLFESFLVTNKALMYLFTIPSIDQKTKERGLIFLAEKFELPPSFYSLMLILLFSRRISLLPQVLCAIVTLYKRIHGIERFVIQSSHPLCSQDLEQLQQFLIDQLASKNTEHNTIKQDAMKVICSYKQDKKLIAGIRMQSENYLWEHSIERQLRAIELLLLR